MGKAKTLKEFLSIYQKIPCTIFGAGSGGRRIFKELERSDISVDCFVDNFLSGYDKITGIEIIKPLQMVERYLISNVVIISIMTKSSSDIVYNQLKMLGFSDDNIYTYENVIRFYKDYDFSFKDRENNYDWEYHNTKIQIAAKWIDENDFSIVDYGAGNMFLKTLISPEILYIPIDYFKRFPEMLVCDFNKDPFPNIFADVGFAQGILNYIKDPKRFIANVCAASKNKVITSYNFVSNINICKFAGYANNLTYDQIVTVFNDNGFVLYEKEPWENSIMLFYFRKENY